MLALLPGNRLRSLRWRLLLATGGATLLIWCLAGILSYGQARQEAEEITVIERFLPRQMDEAEIKAAVKAAIAETGVGGIKDMGKVMAALKASHAGCMDFAKAGAVVKAELGG